MIEWNVGLAFAISESGAQQANYRFVVGRLMSLNFPFLRLSSGGKPERSSFFRFMFTRKKNLVRWSGKEEEK